MSTKCVCVWGVRVCHLATPLPSPRLTDLHDENVLPQKDLETLQYRSQGEGHDNFALSYPRERDTPEEGSDFSEFEHLDHEEDEGSGQAYYARNQQEFVVVDDMTKLVMPDEDELAAYRHNAPDNWFDDPAYARINTLHHDNSQQTTNREKGRPFSTSITARPTLLPLLSLPISLYPPPTQWPR